MRSSTAMLIAALAIAAIAMTMTTITNAAAAGSNRGATVTFVESGLPAGTQWSIALNGTTKSSTSRTIDFNESGGTYTFVVKSIPGYIASPSTGTITVNRSIPENIIFTPVKSATGSITCEVNTTGLKFSIMAQSESGLMLYGPGIHVYNCPLTNVTLNDWSSIIIIAYKTTRLDIDLPSDYYPYCYPNNVTNMGGSYVENGGGKAILCTIHGYSSLTLYRLSMGIEAGAAVMLLAFFIVVLVMLNTRRGA